MKYILFALVCYAVSHSCKYVEITRLPEQECTDKEAYLSTHAPSVNAQGDQIISYLCLREDLHHDD